MNKHIFKQIDREISRKKSEWNERRIEKCDE